MMPDTVANPALDSVTHSINKAKKSEECSVQKYFLMAIFRELWKQKLTWLPIYAYECRKQGQNRTQNTTSEVQDVNSAS